MLFRRKDVEMAAIALPEDDENKQAKLTGYENIAMDGLGKIKNDGIYKPENSTKSTTKKLPINSVGIFSYIFATWFSPLVWRIFKERNTPVDESTIWQCSEEEGVRQNTERIKRLWQEEISKYGLEKASFYRVWVRFVWVRILIGIIWMTVYAVAYFMTSAFLVNLILSYLLSTDDNIWQGITLVVAVVFCVVTRVSAYSYSQILGHQTGTRFRSGMNGLLYDKLLRLKALKGKHAEILNIFSIDSDRVYMICPNIVILLSSSSFIAIAIVYCYLLIGFWCVLVIGTFAVCYLIQILLSKAVGKFRKSCTQYTNTRVRYMSEILQNMKFIKMYAWEQTFEEAVKGERRREKRLLLWSAMCNVIAGTIIPAMPTVASVVSLSAYAAVGNDLTAPKVFALIGTLNFLRPVVAMIPLYLWSYEEAKISFERIKGVLMLEEYEMPASTCLNKANVIEIKASFAWDEDGKAIDGKQDIGKQTGNALDDVKLPENGLWNKLTDITLDVKQGKLLGICGAVGSGKSSLMTAILGRMPIVKGHLAVSGKLAYVAQQAWILSGTVKENILFGKAYDEERYKDVICCCGLEPDLQLFDHGDQTEIGERGITLSGGQKQRVNLARAAYANSDIYILDDPLSALDTAVGKQVFYSCIRGLLKNKTVLLATHQLQYFSNCDDMVVLEEGKLVERGLHEDLLKNCGLYSEMFKTFEQTALKSKQADDAPEAARNTSDVTNILLKNLQTENGREVPVKHEKSKTNLVMSEESSVGTVSFSTYNAFIKAGGGYCVTVIVMALYLLAAGSLVFSDWWLSIWVDSNTMKVTNDVINMMSENETTTENVTWQITQRLGIVSDLDNDSYLFVYVLSLIGLLTLQLTKACALAKVTIKANNKLHSKCLDKILKAPVSFFESNPTGRILNRFTKDLDEGDMYIPLKLSSVLQMLCLTVLTFFMASAITPWIMIAIGLIIAVFLFIKQVSAVSVRQLKRLENVSRSPLISHVNVTSQGLPTIVTYEQQTSFRERCVEIGNVASSTRFLFEISVLWNGSRLDLAAGFFTAIVTVLFVLTKGTISVTSAGLVLSLCEKANGPLYVLMKFMNELEARFTSVERLHEYDKTLPHEKLHGSEPSTTVWPSAGAVEFRKVFISYRPDLDPVLRSVSFSIKPREKTGVVGRTGAGKSSLVVSLLRLVELKEGTILVDGQDISGLSLTCLRSRISSIPQDPVLFRGTVRYNIDPFSNHSDDEIWQALEKVHMKQKILQSNDNLNMKVEENGINFSVGERQLICMTRAVLRSSKILLLDEATANIDTSTDVMIQETIRTCFADCTVITIAHRLNTVLHSDKLIVMDAGRVVECGTPQDLIADPDSHLNEMITAQNLNY